VSDDPDQRLQDLMRRRLDESGMAFLRRIESDILMADDVSILVYPTYASGARRYALKLTTIVDKARVHTMLDGSYRTHRGARRAADIAEQSTRSVLRRLRPETFRGVEQAIFGSPAYYAEIALKVAESDKEPPCSPTPP
jgi:hypothetical protein